MIHIISKGAPAHSNFIWRSKLTSPSLLYHYTRNSTGEQHERLSTFTDRVLIQSYLNAKQSLTETEKGFDTGPNNADVFTLSLTSFLLAPLIFSTLLLDAMKVSSTTWEPDFCHLGWQCRQQSFAFRKDFITKLWPWRKFYFFYCVQIWGYLGMGLLKGQKNIGRFTHIY